jgi:hypothetical protein
MARSRWPAQSTRVIFRCDGAFTAFGAPDPGFRFGGDGGLSGGIYMYWSNEWHRRIDNLMININIKPRAQTNRRGGEFLLSGIASIT